MAFFTLSIIDELGVEKDHNTDFAVKLDAASALSLAKPQLRQDLARSLDS
jgi:hypothetical protein